MTVRHRLVALCMAFALTACDSGPAGPVVVMGTVEWAADSPPPGGVILYLSGPGMEQVQGEGGTQSWVNPPPGVDAGTRVLLIHTGATDPIRFSVRLESADLANPVATVLEVTGRDNERIPVSPGYTVRFDR